MAHRILSGGCLLACLLTCLLPPASADETLRVATRHVPPFAIRDAGGDWSGLSIELWRRIAQDLGVAYRLEAMGLQEMLRGLETGEVDLAVAALTVTPKREERFDFSHPVHTSGLGIAVFPEATSGWWSLRGLLTSQFFQLSGVLLLLAVMAALAVWLFERRRNPGQFGGTGLAGVGSALWWAFVTLTTVGYGDKAPVTLGGRLVASLWMLACVVLVSVFTGSVASVLTVSQLATGINGPEDLQGVRVATVAASTSELWLLDRGIEPHGFSEVGEALQALVEGRVEAVVYDAPILRYLTSHDGGMGAEVLPGFFERQNYAFGLPEGHPLRERINRSLLKHLSSPHWRVLLQGYLGTDA